MAGRSLRQVIVLLSLAYAAVLLVSIWTSFNQQSSPAQTGGVPPPPPGLRLPRKADGGDDAPGRSAPPPSNFAETSVQAAKPLERGGTTTTAPAKRAKSPPLSNRRFPAYGTAAFDRTCPYAARAGTDPSGCQIYATVYPSSNEGISAWAALVSYTFLNAAQLKCGVKVDYGRESNVSVPEVLSPIDFGANANDTNAAGEEEVAPHGRRRRGVVLDWTAPRGFQCLSAQCRSMHEGSLGTQIARDKFARALLPRGAKLEFPMAAVPRYRFAYTGGPHHGLFRDNFTDALASSSLLPGFEIETGMACAWGRMFRLAQTATKYRPDLFTRIWPALHADDAYVIALYIRTRHADKAARLKKEGKEMTAEYDDNKFNKAHGEMVACAAQLEERNVVSERGDALFRQSVWLVVTDSPKLAEHIASKYDTTDGITFGKNGTSILPRRVVTTSSRGVHSKPQNGPDTADWADGGIDWYLIGESDAVISHGSLSFGSTAALRTARPLYNVHCERKTLVVEG